MNGHQAGGSLAGLVLASYGVARSLRRDHGHVYILRRNNLVKVNIKAVGEHQHVALLQVRLNVLLVHGRLQLVVDQNHDNVCPLRSLGSCINLKPLCLGARPGFASLVKADNHVAAGFLRVQSLRMALASVADYRNGLTLQKGKIAVFLIIDLCHFFIPPSYCFVYDQLKS